MIRGTAMISKSRLLTPDETKKFAHVLQAGQTPAKVPKTPNSPNVIPQELNYNPDKTYIWTLRDIYIHPTPHEARKNHVKQ